MKQKKDILQRSPGIHKRKIGHVFKIRGTSRKKTKSEEFTIEDTQAVSEIHIDEL